jgi:hypothetical protein
LKRVNNKLKKNIKKMGLGEKPHLKKKNKTGLVQVRPGHPGHVSTSRVNRVLLDFYTGRSLALLGTV